MRNTSTELKVGIFAIVVIIFLSYMTFKVGGLPLIWEKGYRLYVRFDDISGLDEQSRIKVAGVDAGIVEKISLEKGKAKLTLLISPDIEVYKDAVASLKMSGLLGDRYIFLTTGTPEMGLLQNGDTIANAVPAADFDTLANQLSSVANSISALTENVRNVFGEAETVALRESIRNMRILTKNLSDISSENREPLRNLITQLEDFSKELGDKGPGIIDDMSRVVKVLDDRGPALIDNLNQAAVELKSVLAENRAALKESIDSIHQASKSASKITRKIEEGEGTIGKLMTDDELYRSLRKVSSEAGKSLDVVGRLRTFMDFRTEYNTEEAEWKGFFDLTLKPKDEMYYVLGVVSDPRGSVKTTRTVINSGVEKTEEEIEEDKIEFSAQIVRRFQDFALRIGLMESTFGLGADYFFKNDTGRVKFDIWDFGADEAGSDKSHVRFGIDYRIFEHIFVSGGIDNLLNSNRRGIYVGGGLTFEDEDFKYLFGRSPNISVP